MKQGICIKYLQTLAEFLHFAFWKTNSLKEIIYECILIIKDLDTPKT